MWYFTKRLAYYLIDQLTDIEQDIQALIDND